MSSTIRAIIFLILAQTISSQIVEIEDGKIQGSVMTSRLGREFNAFRNIPFAEPPVGRLRYAAPIPNRPWTGILNATVQGPICAQSSRMSNVQISEDCLQLNVYSHNLPAEDDEEPRLLPVIVYVHGGAFEIGSGATSGPQLLMDRELVAVFINYRLSSFGFLALNTSEIPGNAALKDQALALQWVQKNIQKFGGDPNRVTLAGQSAGAHGVTAHFVSPMSKGLFHGAIAMSGAIAWQKDLQRENIDTARIQAELIGCPSENLDEMLECFYNTPWQTIVATNSRVAEISECPMLSWMPVVEPDFGQERFIEEEPVKLFREGNFARVPVITGVAEDEFSSSANRVLNTPWLLDELNQNFEVVGPLCFNYESNTTKSLAISERFRNAYFPFDTIDRRSFNNLINIFADGTIGYGVHRFAHLIAPFTDVFYYKFTYIGRFSFFYHPRRLPYGVHHTDDLQYAIFISIISPMITPEDPEHVIIERFTRIWENFATTGNPNPINANDSFLSDLEWNKLDLELENFLDFGNHMIEQNGLFLERFSLWDEFDSA